MFLIVDSGYQSNENINTMSGKNYTVDVAIVPVAASAGNTRLNDSFQFLVFKSARMSGIFSESFMILLHTSRQILG
jgi:hypothetical protein